MAAATKGPQVQRVHKVQRVQRGRWAALKYRRPPLIIKPYNRALGAMENQATGLRPMEMHPYPRLSAVLLHGKASHVIFRSLSLPYKSRSLATPEGEVCSPLSRRTHKHLKA